MTATSNTGYFQRFVLSPLSSVRDTVSNLSHDYLPTPIVNTFTSYVYNPAATVASYLYSGTSTTLSVLPKAYNLITSIPSWGTQGTEMVTGAPPSAAVIRFDETIKQKISTEDNEERKVVILKGIAAFAGTQNSDELVSRINRDLRTFMQRTRAAFTSDLALPGSSRGAIVTAYKNMLAPTAFFSTFYEQFKTALQRDLNAQNQRVITSLQGAFFPAIGTEQLNEKIQESITLNDRTPLLEYFNGFVEEMQNHLNDSSTHLLTDANDHSFLPFVQILSEKLEAGSDWRIEMDRLISSSSVADLSNFPALMQAAFVSECQQTSAFILESYDAMCQIYLGELTQSALQEGSLLKNFENSITNAGEHKARSALANLESALTVLLDEGKRQFAVNGDRYRSHAQRLIVAKPGDSPISPAGESEGIVERIGNQIEAKGIETLSKVKDMATKCAHPLLAETSSAIKQLKTSLPKKGALRAAQLEQIAEARTKINRLIDERTNVAPNANGLFKELLSLNAQLTAMHTAKEITEPQSQSLNTRADAVLPQIDLEIQQQQGLIAQVFDAGFRQLSDKLQPIIDYFAPKPEADTGGETLPLSSLIQFARRYLSTSSDKMSSFKKFFNVGVLLLNALPKAKEQLHKFAGSNPKFHEIENVVDASIASLKKGVNEFDIESFEKGLTESTKAIDAIRIYASGIQLPSSLNTVALSLKELIDGLLGDPEVTALEQESHLTDLVGECERVTTTSALVPQRAPGEDILDQISNQKDLFVRNTAKMAKLRIIFEYVCGLKSEDLDFYVELIHKCSTDEELNERVMEKLEHRKVSWFRQALSSWLLSTSFIEGILKQAAENIIKRVLDYIEANKGTHFAHLRHSIIHNFNSYLYTLIGAYRRIGSSNEYTGELSDMLSQELENPKFNGGFTSPELYSEFSRIVTEGCISNPLYRWVAKKVIGKEGELIDNLIKTALSTIVDYNGYSHAINTVLLEEMETLYHEITKGKEPTDEELIALKNISTTVKGDIKSLVKNLLELMHLSPNTTPSQLYATSRNKNSLHDSLAQSADALFIDDAVQAASENIAVAFRTLLTEDRLKELIFKVARLANDAYQRGEPIPPTEFQEKEKKLKETSERLLRFVVKKAVNEALQPKGEKDQKFVNDTIAELKTEIESETGFIRTTQTLLDELTQMDLILPPALSKIEALQSHAQAFFTSWARKARDIEGSQLSSENKELLLNLIDKGLSTHAKDFNSLLCNMTASTKRNTTQEALNQNATAFFASSRAILNQMNLRYNQFDLSQVAEAIAQMETQVGVFKQYTQTQSTAENIKTKIDEIGRLSADFKKNYILFGTCLSGDLERLSNELINARQNNLASDPSDQEKGIAAQITALLSETDPSIQSAFAEQSQRILHCKHRAYLNELALKQDALILSSRNQAEDYVLVQGKIQTLIWESCDAIHACGAAFSHSSDEQRIELWNLVKNTRASLDPLDAWKNREVEPLTFINLSLLPHQRIKQFAGSLVSSRIREKMHGFMNFFRDPLHYRYGVLHHSLMIPIAKAFPPPPPGYLKKMGKVVKSIFA
ncbi:MAG: hypothetical protein V4492_03115 [Chlamydiota bacterium]